MQFIIYSDDADPASIVQVTVPVQLFSMKLAYSADTIWFEVVCAFWERKRVLAYVIHSHCLWNYVSHLIM